MIEMIEMIVIIGMIGRGVKVVRGGALKKELDYDYKNA